MAFLGKLPFLENQSCQLQECITFFTKNDTNGIFLHIISNAFGKFLKKGQSNFTKKYLFYEEIDILLNSNFWEKSVKKWGFS